jgi:hypothetical protein
MGLVSMASDRCTLAAALRRILVTQDISLMAGHYNSNTFKLHVIMSMISSKSGCFGVLFNNSEQVVERRLCSLGQHTPLPLETSKILVPLSHSCSFQENGESPICLVTQTL